MNGELYIGILSGTSIDAVDCALVDFSTPVPRIIDFQCKPFPLPLKQEILSLCSNQAVDLRQLGSLDIAIARLFADSILELMRDNNLVARQIQGIGSHGQTIWHEPPGVAERFPFTLQIGDPNTLAQLTGITVVADLRRRDMAAGGHGAPLVPALHRELFSSQDHDRFIVNLGGIANITYLPSSSAQPKGFDTGPANVLMDAWIREKQGQEYDAEGAWAASGRPDSALLELLLAEPYFSRPPPKSTGRELLNLDWLRSKLKARNQKLAAEDVQATLLELSATTIANEISRLGNHGDVVACGGGARNNALLESLRRKLAGFRLLTSQELGVDPDCVEALAFAWFARKTLASEAIDFRPFTGARQPVIAGGIYSCGQ